MTPSYHISMLPCQHASIFVVVVGRWLSLVVVGCRWSSVAAAAVAAAVVAAATTGAAAAGLTFRVVYIITC